MPKLTGVFENFRDLEAVTAQNILRWISAHPNPITVENFVANRIIYPQVVPESMADLELDMAILREAIRTSHEFVDLKNLRIFIPETLFSRIPDLTKLVWVFVDAYLIGWNDKNPGKNVWTVVLKRSQGEEILGSVIMPEFHAKNSCINLTIRSKNIQVKKGQLSVVPCASQCKFSFSLSNGLVLGMQQGLLQVPGGKLGLMIDGR